jgi:[lysine-biosynthesis-protein LysW]--L-2-aminoadipate ligase
VVADRLGWEERAIISRLRERGAEPEWINDEAMCLGPVSNIGACDRFLIRSRSYVRGRLVAVLLAEGGNPTINAPATIQRCENKLDTLRMFRQVGVPVPDFRLILSRKDLHRACHELRLPLVLKPVYGGLGRRVSLMRERDVADAFYDHVEDLGHGFECAQIAESYIDGSAIRCLIAGTTAVAVAEFRRTTTDWRTNAATGSVPVALSPNGALGRIVDRVVEALGPGLYGLDVLRTGSGKYFANEVNHVPGFRAVEEATGIDIAAVVANHVTGALA